MALSTTGLVNYHGALYYRPSQLPPTTGLAFSTTGLVNYHGVLYYRPSQLPWRSLLQA